MTDFQKGDRVKVTVEGEVTHVYGDGDIEVNTYIFENSTRPESCTVEKIEPPVEVFGPGDVVRYIGTTLAPSTLALGEKGVLNLGTGNFHQYGCGFVRPEQITSREYEKVNLG